MELFLSYSRRDSAIGERLRTDLEASGHHVWIDTDDIRGGEQWRASIAMGIAKADRVLLLVSPNSMQSQNVAREISVADDHGKPILPIVIEPSEIPAEFQYLLSGVQELRFEGRPYESTLTELLEDLGGPAAITNEAPVPVWEPARRQPTRRRFLKPALFLIAASGLAAIGLSQFDGARPSEGPTEPTTRATPQQTLAPTTLHLLGGSAWLAGVEFSPHEAAYDPASEEVIVDYQVDVRQTETRTWFELYPSMSIQLADDRVLTAWRDSGEVPGLGTASLEVTYCCTPAGSDLSSATFVFGRPTEQRWTLPMKVDGTGTGPVPIHLDTTGRVEADGMYFDITDIDLVPWACVKASDGGAALTGMTVFGPVSDDRFTVMLTGTLGANASVPSSGGAADSVSLTQPNGNQSASVGSYTLYGANESATQVPFCFLVDAPGTGSYRLNWSTPYGGTDAFDFTIE